jgi:hypothetical protein
MYFLAQLTWTLSLDVHQVPKGHLAVIQNIIFQILTTFSKANQEIFGRAGEI